MFTVPRSVMKSWLLQKRHLAGSTVNASMCQMRFEKFSLTERRKTLKNTITGRNSLVSGNPLTLRKRKPGTNNGNLPTAKINYSKN